MARALPRYIRLSEGRPLGSFLQSQLSHTRTSKRNNRMIWTPAVAIYKDSQLCRRFRQPLYLLANNECSL